MLSTVTNCQRLHQKQREAKTKKHTQTMRRGADLVKTRINLARSDDKVSNYLHHKFNRL